MRDTALQQTTCGRARRRAGGQPPNGKALCQALEERFAFWAFGTRRCLAGTSVALAATLSVGSAAAADLNGQFAMKGVAVLSCSQFIDARAAGGEPAGHFRNWLDGYLTAANRYEPQTYDAAPWGTSEVLAVVIENHCRQNLEESFALAVQRLVLTMREDRLETASPLQSVTEGGRTILIYEEVLRRVQQRLAERGLYTGQPDGAYGPRTEQAIATFQISEGLDGTGLPDPLTVWKLMKP